MALYTQARRRGQMLSNRRRNVVPGINGPKPPVPGQTPPINPGQTVPRPIPTPTPAPGKRPNPLPTLNQNQQQMLQQAYAGEGGFGTRAGPGMEAMRRLMRQGMESGLRRGQVNQYLNPGFSRGINDPYGGGQLLKNLDAQTLAEMSKYARGTKNTNAMDAQANFFDAFPELQQQYIAQANAYKQGPDPTNGASTTPPNAQLGSDGKYHDPNKPLPPGVTLDAPEGATAPLTQPISQVAEAGHGTPQAALNAGKDPTKHLAYWQEKGWVYNDATDQWTNRNGTTPGQTPPINPGQTVPTPEAAAPQAGAASPQMPLDPAYIAAQRAAQLQLNSTLQGTYPALEQIGTQNDLALARMNTNQGYDVQALKEALSSRGALQSSIYGDERGNLATNYMRTGQDLAADVANAQSQVFQQQQGAYNDYYGALIEALLASANQSATSEYTPVGRTKRKPKKKKRGTNRGGK